MRRTRLELEDAIHALARRSRKPQDLAELIERGDRALELLAGAASDELIDLDGIDARAVGYLAGLALTLRQALRHYAVPVGEGGRDG